MVQCQFVGFVEVEIEFIKDVCFVQVVGFIFEVIWIVIVGIDEKVVKFFELVFGVVFLVGGDIKRKGCFVVLYFVIEKEEDFIGSEFFVQ